MLAIEVINRTTDNMQRNKQSGFPAHFSRLEKWKGKELPGQTKALYPLGCLAFKHVPEVLRSKLDQHATPAVYLGVDPKSGAYLLGSLYELNVSTSVDVTFVENVFPFRKIKHHESPSSLLWGTDHNLSEGDPRLGMFGTQDSSGVYKVLDRQALKSIGALPTGSAATSATTEASASDFFPEPAASFDFGAEIQTSPVSSAPHMAARLLTLLACAGQAACEFRPKIRADRSSTPFRTTSTNNPASLLASSPASSLSPKLSCKPLLPNLQIKLSNRRRTSNGWLR